MKKTVEHLPPVSINWLDQQATYDELCTYVRYDVDVPLTQEDQLELLMNMFTLGDLKAAFNITLGKVDLDDPSEKMLPKAAQKKAVISMFIALIYDHRCMMYDDSKDAFR